MTAVAAPAGPDVERFVWTGRLEGAWPGGADGWSHSREGVIRSLEQASELVVLDTPSFPWGLWRGARRDVRVVARLPEDLDADQIELLLGAPLLSQITPYDRLLDGRADVRAELTQRFDLPDVWVPFDDPSSTATGPGASWRPVLEKYLVSEHSGLALARTFKPRFNQVIQAVAEDLRDRLSSGAGDESVEETSTGARPLVAVAGPREFRPQLFASPLDAVSLRLEAFDEVEPEEHLPDPDAVIVILQDGGQTPAERIALFSSVDAHLHPGTVLLVVGHVVTQDEGRENPGIQDLVEELNEVTGCALQLEELRSLRWAGEALSRGVLLRFTSLRVRVV